ERFLKVHMPHWRRSSPIPNRGEKGYDPARRNAARETSLEPLNFPCCPLATEEDRSPVHEFNGGSIFSYIDSGRVERLQARSETFERSDKLLSCLSGKSLFDLIVIAKKHRISQVHGSGFRRTGSSR